jgi:catechol 2,3-dioxygenase-like lactoylglutathione lyase family enzyme
MARPNAVFVPHMSGGGACLAEMYIEQVSLIVDEYDEAIRFFVGILGFELVEDSPALSSRDGRPKRWVVVRPPGAETALLLARADGEREAAAVGDQFAGRIGLFLRVEDFHSAYGRMCEAGVEFVGEARDEPYGRVAVFLDVAGNRWDLLGPRPARWPTRQ